MKKLMVLVSLAMVMFLAIPAYADYKEAVREDIRKELGAFFQRNEGNKLTIDLIDGLAIHMGQIFEQNKIKEEVPKIEKPVSPVKKEVQK